MDRAVSSIACRPAASKPMAFKLSPARSGSDRPLRLGALRHRDFRLLWIGLLVSNTGTWARNIAQGWLLYQISDSRLMLGALAISFALPMTILPLFGGVIADRFDRLTIVKYTQFSATILAAVLSWLTLTGRITAWQIVCLSFLGAIVLAIDNPTRQALIPALVPRADLASAMALNGITFTGAGLIGSALAGTILQLYEDQTLEGAAIVFGLNSISYLAVLIPLFYLSPNGQAKSDRRSQSALADLSAGLAYLRSHSSLGLLISLSAMTNLLGRSFLYLMPVLARDVLAVGASGLGTMNAIASAGTLAGGLGLAAMGGVRRQRAVLFYSVSILITSVLVLALSPWYPVSLIALGINGAATAITSAAIATGIQADVEEGMRGRMMSYYTLTIIGLAPLGSGIAGAMAQWMPVQWAIILPAVILLLLLFGVIIRAPAWQQLP
jgi:MFS family permease